MKRFQYVVVYWLPVFVYCLFIYIQSSFSYPESIPKFPYIDKLAHFLIYAGLGILFLRAFRSLCVQSRKIVLITASIAAATLYGISDEFHQLYVPYRVASGMDIFADAIGSAFGAIIYTRMGE